MNQGWYVRCVLMNQGCRDERSFWALMRTTRQAILMDARNGLLGNRCAQGMRQIPEARNLHPGCTQSLQCSALRNGDLYQSNKSKHIIGVT